MCRLTLNPCTLVIEGCTLTVNVEHGVKLCPLSLVKSDLKERKITTRNYSEQKQRDTLELILREEEEWQQMVMYQRDFRFHVQPVHDNDFKNDLGRTIIDMLHCPMRMHEKILTLLYTELLNGKTKKEVNVGRQTKQYLPPSLGQKAVGSAVAKLFQFPDGATQVFHGCVRLFTVDDDGGLYSIRYDDGDTEDIDCDEFCAGHELATTLNSTSDDAIADKTTAFRKKLSSPLENLTDMIRHLGELGPTWTHQWSDTDAKALKNIKLPLELLTLKQIRTLRTMTRTIVIIITIIVTIHNFLCIVYCST